MTLQQKHEEPHTVSLAHRLPLAAAFVMMLAGCTGVAAGSAPNTTTTTTSTTMPPFVHGDPPLCPRIEDHAPAVLRGASPGVRIVLARSGKRCWLLPGTYDPEDPSTWPKRWPSDLPAAV